MNKMKENNFENLKKILAKIKVVLLDLDGTVYIGNRLIGEVVNTLQLLRDSGKQLVFLTNNSSKTNAAYVKKLKAMNVFRRGDCVYTSGDCACEVLKSEYAGKSVYMLANAPLKKQFLSEGINVVEDNADVALMAYDTSINFKKIKKFNEQLNKGCVYLATHPDAVCPAPVCSMPDVGSFIEMFYQSSGRRPNEIIGKPYTGMGRSVMRKFGVNADQVLMVGDRLYTDIKFAVNNGFYSLLVFSGETTPEMYEKSDVTASFALQSINELVRY